MEQYEKPYTYDECLKIYGEFLANKLFNDPVHRWRMETGIELIHKEPTLDEQKRIWKNWQLMMSEQKKLSDEKCLELTSMTNEELNNWIMKMYWDGLLTEKPKNKFDLVYEKIISEHLNKCNKSKYILSEVNFPLIRHDDYNFLKIYNSLIMEDYHIFPVPKLLLDDIEKFVNENDNDNNKLNNYVEKKYLFKDILTKYTTDWKYYKEFNENVKLMLKKNIKCSITCCLFKTLNQVKEIIKKYNIDEEPTSIYYSNASIHSCGDSFDFDACLCLNSLANSNKIRKAIQHELIHWMQVTLNSETKKSYGVFNDIEFNLTDSQLKLMETALHMNADELITNFKYVLSGKEFEAWVANSCEDFDNLNISIDQFKHIIENDLAFISIINNINKEFQETFIFAKICQLASKNNPKDDRYWYLIEALKENKED